MANLTRIPLLFLLSWLAASWLGWVSVALTLDDLARPELWLYVGGLLAPLHTALLWWHLQPRWRLAWVVSTLLGFGLMGFLISLTELWPMGNLLYLLVIVVSVLPLGIGQQIILKGAGYTRRLWLPAQPLAILLALLVVLTLDNLTNNSLSVSDRLMIFTGWGLSYGLVTGLALSRTLFSGPQERQAAAATS